MNQSTLKKIAVALSICIPLFGQGKGIVATDSFDQSPQTRGSVNGQATAPSWSIRDTWSGADAVVNVGHPNLIPNIFPDGYGLPEETANPGVIESDEKGRFTIETIYSLESVDSGTLWVSYLVNRRSTSSVFDRVGVTLTNGPEKLYIGSQREEFGIGSGAGIVDLAASKGLLPGQTHLILAKVDLDNGTASAWLDPMDVRSENSLGAPDAFTDNAPTSLDGGIQVLMEENDWERRIQMDALRISADVDSAIALSRLTDSTSSDLQLSSRVDSTVETPTPNNPAHSRSKTAPPNILFLFADDLGWGDLGSYGNRLIKTPNMDRLASEGRLFTQGYVLASVCSPSRAAALTGLFPARTGVHGHFASPQMNRERNMPDSLDPSFPTIARSLQKAGYATGHLGKWHLGEIDATQYGFDLAKTVNGGVASSYNLSEGYYEFFHESAERFTDDAITFMRDHRDAPFYLQVWYLEPHAPNLPLDQFLALYKQPGRVPEKWIIPEPLIEYMAVVSSMDYQIGRILDALEDLGLANDTMIVLSSDNGPEDHNIMNVANTLGMGKTGPLRGRKRSLYDGGVRVPFIVRFPGKVPQGSVDTENIVSTVDLFPSFAALAGVDVSDLELDGVNVLPAFAGQTFERTKPLLWEWRSGVSGHPANVSPTHAIRLGPWKYLVNFDGTRPELYNLEDDPMEIDNVASDNPGITRELDQQIREWRKTIVEWNAPSWAGKQEWNIPGE